MIQNVSQGKENTPENLGINDTSAPAAGTPAVSNNPAASTPSLQDATQQQPTN